VRAAAPAVVPAIPTSKVTSSARSNMGSVGVHAPWQEGDTVIPAGPRRRTQVTVPAVTGSPSGSLTLAVKVNGSPQATVSGAVTASKGGASWNTTVATASASSSQSVARTVTATTSPRTARRGGSVALAWPSKTTPLRRHSQVTVTTSPGSGS
jgi:hypothetical protein